MNLFLEKRGGQKEIIKTKLFGQQHYFLVKKLKVPVFAAEGKG
jgi:hypothetical protein